MFNIDSTYLQIFLGVISALILFLYAIDNLSSEFQKLASDKFRKVIAVLAKNRFTGMLVGAISTAIIQSSSAVSVIAVVLVNTGVISFRNSLGIIFGTNIGTTVTAQLALISSTALAPILIILGTFFGLIGKKFKLVSKPIFFLGFILFTLNLLSGAIIPLRDNPEVINLFAQISHPIIAYLVSAAFTMMVQSSSVTSGIIVILAMGGLIPIEVAIPMMLGTNLGSSTTALIASTKMNLYAKRAGFSKFLFCLIGTVIFMIFLSPFTILVTSIVDGPAVQAAVSHLLFNVLNALIFLTFLTPFEKLVTKIIKGDEEEVLFKPKFLDGGKGSSKEQIKNIKKELIYSVENTVKIYEEAIGVYYHHNQKTIMNIQKLETLNDFLDDEITSAIVDLSKNKLSKVDAHTSVLLVKISNTIEQIGDLGQDFSNIFVRMHELGISSKDVCIEQLGTVHSKLLDLIRALQPLIEEPSNDGLKYLKSMENAVYSDIQSQFDLHVIKLQQGDGYNGNVFVDGISVIELSASKVREIRKLLQNSL
jgi:phosphate:Na+ symporter